MLPARVEMVHVGTLGLVFEPMADALEAVVERVAGALAMVDLNIRPLVIHDRDSVPRADRAAAPAHLVKASDDDLAWLDPGMASSRRRGRCSTTGRSRAAHARRRGVTVVTADGETDVPALASTSSTRSAPATRSAAASSPGGGGRGSGAEASPGGRGARGDALRVRRRGRPSSARARRRHGWLDDIARMTKPATPRRLDGPLRRDDIGPSRCGVLAAGAQRGVDLVEREVTGDDRLEVDPARRRPARSRPGRCSRSGRCR